MYRKIRESQGEGREEGFTLIELLVVVIIIGILAAIAIPVFLNQRERAWDSAAQSDLRNAAVSQETYFTDESEYTFDVAELTNRGFREGENVTLSIVSPGDATEADGSTSYCMTASHDNSDTVFEFDSDVGAPVEGDCTP